MTLAAFLATLTQPAPPDLPPLLIALWNAGARRWDAAHDIAQSIDTPDGAWVHAYLHRVEGDLGNARYWYRRAGRPEATDALDAEWRRVAEALLEAAAAPDAGDRDAAPRDLTV
jgi:hypothetical protein